MVIMFVFGKASYEVDRRVDADRRRYEVDEDAMK